MLARRFTWLLAILTILTLSLGGGLSSLALFAPFVAGDPLFPVQQWTEQVRLSLISDKTELAERLLDLLELRVADLEYRAGTPHEAAAVAALDAALDQAARAVDAAPPEARSRLQIRLMTLAARLNAVLRRLVVMPKAQPDDYARALTKADQFLTLTQTGAPLGAIAAVSAVSMGAGTAMTLAATPRPTSTPVVIPAHPVPFPPNATPGTHEFYALLGRHASLACADCHLNGDYHGTPRQCADCHARVRPANHYPGTCDLCHNSSAWTPATFNHAGFANCVSCHAARKPANHYPGQCSACHSTGAWTPATFNHSGFTDCVSCHSARKPANHYNGQCGLCHSTSAWTPATFNHSVINGADCQLCHASRAPANHWPAPCARCHMDTNAWKNALFDHSVVAGADCSACHASRAPANHWPAPCARCHQDTRAWKNARFDHSIIGATDCSACHASRAPANHYGAPCSACHRDTGNWRNATFDHATIGGADCSACHASRAPANHFSAPCRNCHTDTGNWRNVNFSHSFPLNHHGANGECAKCHPGNNYGSWTCTACHAQTKMDEKHKEISNYSSNCLACHADGRKPLAAGVPPPRPDEGARRGLCYTAKHRCRPSRRSCL